MFTKDIATTLLHQAETADELLKVLDALTSDDETEMVEQTIEPEAVEEPAELVQVPVKSKKAKTA